jgi:spore maturation protein CgeB
MRILFSSYHNPYFPTITEYIEDALAQLACQLIIFDDRRHIIPGRIRRRSASLYRFDLRQINQRLVDLAYRMKPDIVLIAGGHRISTDTIEKLKAAGMPTVLWTIDAPLNFKPVLDAAAHYDKIFCQGTEAIEILEKAGVRAAHWLPMACDPIRHRRVDLTNEERRKYQKDIAFVGSYYPNRWETLKVLQEYNLGIWGPNWQNVPVREAKFDVIHPAKLTYQEWVKIYSAAKIVVVVHYNDGRVPCYQASPKLFEAMACESFVIVDKQKDAVALFEDKNHVVYFSNAEELKEKARYYLQSPLYRKTIAKSGYNEVIRKHTYLNRLNDLLNRL